MLNNAELILINPNDLRLLAHDCFDSLVRERSINEQLVSKLKGDISNYLATGTNNGLNEETQRLIDSLIKYLDYQLETRVQSVSVEDVTLNVEISPPPKKL